MKRYSWLFLLIFIGSPFSLGACSPGTSPDSTPTSTLTVTPTIAPTLTPTITVTATVMPPTNTPTPTVTATIDPLIYCPEDVYAAWDAEIGLSTIELDSDTLLLYDSPVSVEELLENIKLIENRHEERIHRLEIIQVPECAKEAHESFLKVNAIFARMVNAAKMLDKTRVDQATEDLLDGLIEFRDIYLDIQ